MADWLRPETGELRISSDPPLDEQVNWVRLVAGDRARVAAITQHYRIVENGAIREATTQENATIDQQRAADEHAAYLAQLLVNRGLAKDLLDHGGEPLHIALRALMKVNHSTFAELRSATGKPPRSWDDAKQAARSVIDAGQADPEE